MNSMTYYIKNIADFILGFSLLGFVEVASVALIVYYVYTKTRAPAIIGSLFPNLNLNLSYRSSLTIFNNMGSEIFTTIRGSTNNEKIIKKESKPAGIYSQQHGTGTQNILQITPHAGRKPLHSIFDWGVYFPFLAQSMRNKKFAYPQVSNLVVNDANLQRAIKQATEEILKEKNLYLAESSNVDLDEEQMLYQDILKKQEKRSYNILMDMRSTINNFLLSLTSWLLYTLLPCFLSGVVMHTQQIEMLKTASEKAPGIPLIFLPLHRSHLDYLMVSFILTNNDIKSPLVAAGNNLQIPVFGRLLRGLGAFFIKRKIDPVLGKKDILYRAVLHLYLQHALKIGHNVEFFIEGGRTRTGKPCLPKNGILSVIVNAFMDETIPDALLVPVSVNYERLVDGNFVREQTGEKKIPETFRKAMSGIWKALTSKYGLMRIDFNEPYSIKELVSSYNKIAKQEGSMRVYKPNARPLQHNQSSSSLYGTDLVCEEHRTLVDSISRQIVYDCAAATSVMTTNALAFLLLTRFRAGGSEEALTKELDSLRKLLAGRRDIGFAGESSQIIRYACVLLGNSLVNRSLKDSHYFIQPNQTIASFIELAYYANTLTPHFALESVVMTALHSLLYNKPENSGVSRKQLIEASLEHCDILRYEFILSKPTQNLEVLLEQTIDDLALRQLIKTVEIKSETDSARLSRKLASYMETDGIDEDYNDDLNFKFEEPELFLEKSTTDEQNAVVSVLGSIGYSYLSVAQSLKILYKNSMLESEFVKFVIKDITHRFETGVCPYAESISTDSVKNCLKLFEKWSVIEVGNQYGLRLLSLGHSYESSPESVQTIINKISATVPICNDNQHN